MKKFISKTCLILEEEDLRSRVSRIDPGLAKLSLPELRPYLESVGWNVAELIGWDDQSKKGK